MLQKLIVLIGLMSGTAEIAAKELAATHFCPGSMPVLY